jgi:hypothetical protein
MGKMARLLICISTCLIGAIVLDARLHHAHGLGLVSIESQVSHDHTIFSFANVRRIEIVSIGEAPENVQEPTGSEERNVIAGEVARDWIDCAFRTENEARGLHVSKALVSERIRNNCGTRYTVHLIYQVSSRIVSSIADSKQNRPQPIALSIQFGCHCSLLEICSCPLRCNETLLAYSISGLRRRGLAIGCIYSALDASSSRPHFIELTAHDGQLIHDRSCSSRGSFSLLNGCIGELFVGFDQAIRLSPGRSHFIELSSEHPELPIRVNGHEVSEDRNRYGGQRGDQAVMSINPTDQSPGGAPDPLHQKSFGAACVVAGYLLLCWGVGIGLDRRRLVWAIVGLAIALVGMTGIIHGFGILTT